MIFPISISPSDVSSIFNETYQATVIAGRLAYQIGLEVANGMIRYIKAIINV